VTSSNPDEVRRRISACNICAERFAATATAHVPRPVVWFHEEARILIAGQAPGWQVHQKGRPFDDPSGVRLREWMGVEPEHFWDRKTFAIVPQAFCFPGYSADGADLPPPRICAETWQADVLASLPQIRLTLLIGGAAQAWHLGRTAPVTDTVRAWRDYAPRRFPLPHPSWRNTGWLKKHPWFEAELLPALRHAIREALR
jgi:uracil-DNA glycosylase